MALISINIAMHDVRIVDFINARKCLRICWFNVPANIICYADSLLEDNRTQREIAEFISQNSRSHVKSNMKLPKSSLQCLCCVTLNFDETE